ncbi:MAG: secondary thiamine-phosphate synthase enzyme YjbQ [Pseudomonadota bacterium]
MNQKLGSISVGTTAKTDILDITDDALAFVAKSKIKTGLFTATVPGSTASITTIEYESGVIRDLERAIERLVPGDMHYDHDARWGDGNGYSHVRAALLKPSLSIPIDDGQIMLGTWQQIVLLDFDNKPRKRKVIFHAIGE